MRILLVTDAWTPQINGVVRTLRSTIAELEKLGHEVSVIAPDQFRSVPCPTYGEIRLALTTKVAVGKRIAEAFPDAIHIATEDPLGLAARSWCVRNGTPFTTAYHTQFPDYLAKRTRLPRNLFWHYIRWFHRPAHAVLVSTPNMMRQLRAHGLPHTRLWGRGVDLDCFAPDVAPHPALRRIARPVQLYAGRVAVEKNVEAFLECRHPGSKVVVGDGPALAKLKRRYPQAAFMGALHGPELASAYAAADVLVFPSRTDTFGLVMIEALACGTPVAAYPVPGPADILRDGVGSMAGDLDLAIIEALRCNREVCAGYGRGFSWSASAQQFVDALAPLHGRRIEGAAA